ncbi:hypothetical protein [Streptomyces sp. NPDC048269]|uniref:hypothetical protein n=1 Tax=Streptomyces sp. NPDC048269 TaxID=3155753 RepID=UPI00342D55A7
MEWITITAVGAGGGGGGGGGGVIYSSGGDGGRYERNGASGGGGGSGATRTCTLRTAPGTQWSVFVHAGGARRNGRQR